MKECADTVGREGLVEKLESQLIRDADDSSKLHVISVLGERAIGKTALVRSVYDRLDIKRCFEHRAWVCILAGSGLDDILFDVLRQTTMRELKEVNCLQEQYLSEMLQKTLSKRRYLVVLDNLQCIDLMAKLQILFPDSRNGSRVIITTRNENMSLHLGPPHSSHLELCRLSENESHRLLMNSGWTDHPELRDAILSKCKGYPPVIRLLGGLLFTVKKDQRSALAEQIPNYRTLGEIISLCYDSLPDWLRHGLLYLVLFPRESEIPVRRLFNIWLADGLSSCRQARFDRVMEYLDALVTRNMIHVLTQKLDGSAKTCLMPGFLHDFLSEMVADVGTSKISDDSMSTSSRQPGVSTIAVKICANAIEEQETMVSPNTFTRPRGARQANMSSLSLYSTKRQSCSPPKLQYIAIKTDEKNRQCKEMQMTIDAKTQYVAKFFRSLMLFTTWKQGEHAIEAGMFLKKLGLRGRFPWLKVLDLEHVYKPTLPKRLGRIMPNLRYLGLRWTVLDSLPKSVQFLSHLETLDLKHTNVARVPRSILKAGSLQHLYMNEICLDQSIHNKALYGKSLAKLKTLWGLHIGGKSAMLGVLGNLTGLKKLGLTCYYMVASSEHVKRLTNLQSLRLRSSDIFGHPSRLELRGISQLQSLSNLHLIGALTATDLRGLPKNLQILTLSMTRVEEDPMEILKELKRLTSLRLLAGSYSGQSLTCIAETFPALRVLKLCKLKLLTRWTIEESALPCLQEVDIRNCTRLIHIVGLEHVQCLEEINLMKVKNALAAKAKARCPKAVVVARELVVPRRRARELVVPLPREEYDDNEEDDKEGEDDDNDDEEQDDERETEADEDEDEKQQNETTINDANDSDSEDGYTNIGGNNEGENLEQESTDPDEDEDEIRKEDKEKKNDDNDNEEGDEMDDEEDNDDNDDEEQDDETKIEADEDEDEKQQDESTFNDADDSDSEDISTDIEGYNEGEDLEQESTDPDEDEDEEREEDEEEEEEEKNDDNDNEERDNNNDEGEDEEQKTLDETDDEDDNNSEEGDDGDNGKEEEEENQSVAEAEECDDSDHEDGDLNDDEDDEEVEGEAKDSQMKMKLKLKMKMKANIKNELTLRVVWKKTEEDKKMKS